MLKIIGIVGIVAYLSGAATSGWMVHKYYENYISGEEAMLVRKELQATKDANALNLQLAEGERIKAKSLQGEINALQSKISTGTCLPKSDAGRLQRLWK